MAMTRTKAEIPPSQHSIDIPDELWLYIIQEVTVQPGDDLFASQNTRQLAKLCRVSRQLDGIVRPILWSTVCVRVSDWPRLPALLHSLLKHPELAELVHTLRFECHLVRPLIRHEYPSRRSLVADCVRRINTLNIGSCLRSELLRRITRSSKALTSSAISDNFEMYVEHIDALIALSAVTTTRMKKFMFNTLDDCDYDEREMGMSLLSGLILQSSWLSITRQLLDRQDVPFSNLKQLHLNTTPKNGWPIHKCFYTLALLCASPELEEFRGCGFEFWHSIQPDPVHFHTGIEEVNAVLTLWLLRRRPLRPVTCNHIRKLVLLDTALWSSTLAYLPKLFQSLVVLEVSSAKGKSDQDLIAFGRSISTFGTKLKSLRLRSWCISDRPRPQDDIMIGDLRALRSKSWSYQY